MLIVYTLFFSIHKLYILAVNMEESRLYFDVIEHIGLKGVANEPFRLRNQADDVKNRIAKNTLKNYHVYLKHSESLSDLSTTTNLISKNIRKMGSKLPEMVNELKLFGKEYGPKCITQYQGNRSTLLHYTKLLELLEVPQLMETCLRNNLYDEALDLVGFANNLQRRHRR